jgi:Leucine-rich repeat (LRR) protein
MISLFGSSSLNIFVPREIEDRIFYFMSPEDFLSAGLINLSWKQLIDQKILSHWEQLKKEIVEGSVNLPLIEKKISKKTSVKQNPRCLFEKLASEFAALGASSPLKVIFITVAGYTELKNQVAQENDKSLMTIWPFINKQLKITGSFKSANEIRAWLADLTYKKEVDRITTLRLDKLGLKNFPVELTWLSGLKALYLQENQLRTLPEEIGNLKLLEGLIVSDNKLIRLPKTIGNLSKLRCLDLRGNQFIKLPKSLDNLSGLQLYTD